MTQQMTGTGPGYQPLPELMKRQQGGFQQRRYDICMVFRYKTKKTHKFEEGQEEIVGSNRNLTEPNYTEKNKMQAWKQRRESLLKQMKNCGLNLFCYYSRDRDEVFCKVGADAEKLCFTAARMKYKLQLKPEYLSAYAEYRQDFRGRPDMHGKDRRNYSQMYERHTEADEPSDDSAIFTTRDKIMIIHHIITSKDKDCAGINIGLLKDKNHDKDAILQHYFPLHEERKLHELTVQMTWRRWIMMDREHSDKVRDYFGDKVAFYYLWMSFYWQWLVIPGVVGAALQILDVCFHTPDNATAVPFCIFLAVWTLFLPHFWRRQEAKYAIAWGTFDMVPELEPCRPEHTGEPRINPVTAQVENYFPWQKRMWKYMWSVTVIVLVGLLLMAAICILMLLRHWKHDVVGGIATWQFIIAIFVEVVNVGLTKVAKNLTIDENHRTQSEHDTHLLAKVFAFKFVNSYFVMYYIAFFKKHGYLFGTQLHCIRNDCLLDLQLALAIFMLVRLFVQNLFEFLSPKFKIMYRNVNYETKMWWHNIFNPSNRLEQADMSAAEVQAKREPYDPFLDFDETLITHGYATLFAVSSPWVCTATLVWIIVETVLDVKNLTENTQRPLPLKMRTNEPWDTAFDVYGVLAAVTNIVMLVFASEQYGAWTFTEKLMMFIMIFHIILIAKLVIKFIFPEVPRSVALLNLKQANMVHRCLENIKVEPQQDFSLFRQHGADNFEVMEQDIFDDEDIEPTLDLKASYATMKSDLRSTFDHGVMLIIMCTVSVTVVLAVALVVYNNTQLKNMR